MQTVLEGILAVELGFHELAPSSARMLGDMGAEVIKVEEPGIGDHMRGLQTVQGVPMKMADGRHAGFEHVNQNKKGISLNLKTAKGREIMRQLLAKADVFVTNYRPQALQKLGLDYDGLHELNPGLVYAIGSAFGTRGPDADLPGIDLAGQARSAVMMQSGEEGMPPVIMPHATCDRIAAICLAYGIVSALFARQKNGRGQRVEASLLGAMTYAQGFPLSFLFTQGKAVPRWNRIRTANPIYNMWECRDGKWLATPLWGVRHFADLCEQLGMPELTQDPRFIDDPARMENSEILVSIIQERFKTKTCQEWMQILKEKDLVCAPVQDFHDLATDPQVIANEYITEWDHPVLGPTKWIRGPVNLSETPLTPRDAAPELGEHTESVLQEMLGYTWGQLGELRDQGVI